MKASIVRSTCVATAIVGILIGGCVETPQSDRGLKAFHKTTFSGTSLSVWYFYAVQMDCTSAGLPTVWVTSAAAHGSVEIQNVDHFTEYPATNQRFQCNKKKSPSVEVIYTSDKNFVGTDKVTLKCVFPAGNVTIRKFQITVESPPTNQPTKGQGR
jgi:hypothetical protein